MVDLYKKYAITEKEVLEWAKKQYPQFLKNKTVLAQLYLKQVKKIQLQPDDITIMRGPLKKIADLKPDQWVIIEVVVGPKTRENSYSGCPMCYKKVEGEYCPACGKVEPILCWFDSYVVGDNTGDLIATMGPKIANSRQNFEGAVMKMRGVLSQQGEFMVSAVEPVSAVPKLMAKKKEEVDLEKELRLIKEIFDKFPSLKYEDLKKWHTSRGLKVDLDVLIREAGLHKWPDGSVKTVPFEAPKAEEAAAIDEAEVKKVKNVLEMFPEVDLDSFKVFYNQEKFKTPMEKLLEAAGAIIEEDKVKKRG